MHNNALNKQSTTRNISSWLHFLDVLMPANGVTLVGAGAGQGEWVKLLYTWKTSNVILFEADETKYRHLSGADHLREDWQTRHQLVAEKSKDTLFYFASNSAENGILKPESLRSLWPNIETLKEKTYSAITLAGLKKELERSFNWLIVDCLPGLPIIKGAGDTLDDLNVVVVRMLLMKEVLPEGPAHQSELDKFMAAQGFRCLSVESERHPAIGYGLYIRDMEAVVERFSGQNKLLQMDQARAENLVAERTRELKAADKTKVEQARCIDELKSQVEQLNQAKADADKLIKRTTQQLEKLNKTREDKKNLSGGHKNNAPSRITLVPFNKHIAFNESYRISWKTYLNSFKKEVLENRLSKLLSNLDNESKDLVNLQLDLINPLSPSIISNFLYFDNNSKRNLIPEKTLTHFKKIQYHIGLNDKLNSLQTELNLPEFPLPELLFHSGLFYIQKLAGLAIRNKSIIDAGAYIGDTAKLFFQYYNPACVYALEPHPTTYNSLVSQISEWKLEDKIIPINSATGSGIGHMNLWGDGVGASVIKKSNIGENDSIKVPATNVDFLVKENKIDNLAMIKFDVEGNEYESILGSINSIINFKPILLISIYHTAKDFFEIKPLLESLNLGYKFLIRKISDDIFKELILIAFVEEK